MKNISNYNNLLEQQLFFDKNDPFSCVDVSASSNILMSNLSHQDIPKNKFEIKQSNKENNQIGEKPLQKLSQRNVLQKSVLGGKVLKYSKPKKETFEYSFDSSLINAEQMFINNPAIQGGEQTKPRKIAPNPYRILYAPGLQDDFYLNLVDWSAQNILAVALESSVYVWNATTSTVEELCDVGLEDQVTSLSWSNQGGHLSIGTKSGEV